MTEKVAHVVLAISRQVQARHRWAQRVTTPALEAGARSGRHPYRGVQVEPLSAGVARVQRGLSAIHERLPNPSRAGTRRATERHAPR